MRNAVRAIPSEMSLCQTKQEVPPLPALVWSNAHNIVTDFKDKLTYCNVNFCQKLGRIQ